MTDPPLDQAWFAAVMERLGPWGAERRVAVAVSGGADSLCLAWLAAGWGRPFALIVDHGLRAGSAAEAKEAARRLAGFGVPSRILTLGLADGPGVPARARAARYAALTEAAAAEGLSDLLLGHHAHDQAETVLMRRQAGSGPDGLAGMANVIETLALRLVRPLLGVLPGRFRTTLEALGVGWVNDPSNFDPRWTRARVRRDLEDGVAEIGHLLGEARAFGTLRALRAPWMADTLARRAALFPEGYALLARGPIEPTCLATLLRGLTGADHAAADSSLARLAADPAPATIGGVRLMEAGRLGPGLLLVREEAAMQRRVPAGHGVVWDRRFRLHAPDGVPAGAWLAALGEDAGRLRRVSPLPASVLRTLPALRQPDGGMAVPHLRHFDGWTNRRVRLTFIPSSPVAGAPFAALSSEA